MQKIYVEFEHEVNGHKYSFKAEPNAPLNEAKEAIFLVLKDIGQIEDMVKSKQAQEEAEKDKVEEPKVENIAQE